jgi:hypothetical protein
MPLVRNSLIFFTSSQFRIHRFVPPQVLNNSSAEAAFLDLRRYVPHRRLLLVKCTSMLFGSSFLHDRRLPVSYSHIYTSPGNQ